MTNHWIDIKNADAVLIIGSNAAEHHPVSFKWIMRAKDKGAVLMHVDPKFSRTSARCDFHVPLRSGTDIAFLGGMVNYILETDSYQKDYVLNYTNASFVVGKGYAFEDGLFSGYDAAARKYDQSKWAFEKGPDGAPVRDASLKNERCVFNLMKKHYSRYTLKNVSDITGVSEDNLLKVYKNFAATGKADKAGTILYALGWTQHTVGVQNIRCSTLVQLLLGNIGVAGGGINALRGEPNVQGSTDHALLYHILPGYIALPLSPWQTLKDFNKANTPVTRLPESANWWGNRPKYMASLLKGWYGEAATPENDFCYGLVPKGEPGVDYSYMYVMDKMYHGQMKGGFVFGVNPMNSFPNTNKMRKALDNLDWMVCAELHNSETTDNWRRPGVDPKQMKTEVFLLPSAHRVEKAGTISNSGRWLLWFDKAVEPAGDARNFADMFVPLINRLREMYKAEGGAHIIPGKTHGRMYGFRRKPVEGGLVLQKIDVVQRRIGGRGIKAVEPGSGNPLRAQDLQAAAGLAAQFVQGAEKDGLRGACFGAGRNKPVPQTIKAERALVRVAGPFVEVHHAKRTGRHTGGAAVADVRLQVDRAVFRMHQRPGRAGAQARRVRAMLAGVA